LQTQRQLPYIVISNPPLKLLIDTGANQSFINPNIVEKYYPNVPLNWDPFEVTNVHATTRNDYSVTVPCFSEFNHDDNITLFLYKFHDYFDGLIGLDLLDKWEANIDLKTKTLNTRHSINKIHMYDSRNCNLYEDIIPAQSSRIIRVPINIKDGEAFIPEQIIANCIIHECITNIKNNRGLLEITNPTNNDLIFSMDRPVTAEIFSMNVSQPTDYSPTRVEQVLSRLRTDHLNDEERLNLEALCAKYTDVFYIEGEPLTFTNRIKHSIRTTDEVPVYTKTYRYPFIHRQEVQEQITKMLEQGIIRPSSSAWSSPIWVVPKKTDASGKTKWRIVIDFRKVNEKTIDDKYPIPNITDVLDKLGNCHYFTTLDLASGFYQVEMNPDDIAKTAFNVEHGHFEFLRMPMGLKNSPSTFQRVMDNVLRDLQNTICLVYLDDIIIFSTSLQEHMVNMEKVFLRLRESNFKIQMDKSEFLKLETAYLGHIISKDGIKPNSDKIAAIQKFPIPKTPTEIKRFLGLLGYYRKFIPDFARITKPMTQCLKKGSKICITNPEYINCFEKCKTLLSNDPILQYPDFSKEFILTTDASNLAMGAVLSQGPIGSDKPIAYASRTFNTSETNYSTIEKELFAIVWATKYFRPYLFGRKFKIITDHKPLQWVMSLKEPSSRLTRWRLRLSEYNFTVIYKPGKSNVNADALSRIEINNEDVSSILVNPSECPPEITGSTTATAHTSAEHPILEIPISDDSLNKFSRQIILTVVGDIKKRPVVTKPFETHMRTSIQLSESNLEDDVVSAIKEYVNPKVRTGILIHPPLAMYKIVPIIQEKFKSSTMNLMLTKLEVENIKEYLRQQDIIQKYHEGKTNHRGATECYLALSAKYFWPKMREHISKYINECNICGMAKYDRNPIKQKFSIVPPPTKPFETLHIDLFTVDNEKYLTMVDAFSKYAQAYHLRDGTAVSVIQALLKYFTHHGVPLTIISDQGPEFSNQLFSEFSRLHQIIHHKTLAHNPNSNGIVERFHSTILEHLRILKLEHPSEAAINLMSYAILGYNSSIHSFNNCRPIEVITGHFDPRDPVDMNMSEHLLQQYVANHKQRMAKVYDILNETSLHDRTELTENRNKDRETEKEYSPEDQVFIRNPLASRQKLAPRYTQDVVLADLPIHIYTKKKKGPIAKSRLKRKPNSNPLLQDTPVDHSIPDQGSRRGT
jgi:transposase InsO family protein